ncbi:MAG TPA: efflux RND transporter periplasmic adaptor subunit [Polaromonas sp.]|uniref:efflux RND transporter periplasmic adaptor subunit n=1 Tax=Polaromonas sp. TaxID=1869339 RepID=UPI002D5BF59A|nr:efflux RND transporter periplasmic adaptor subunit [Polaromonas sp.]HYW57815.1 efflux RND transporter periplasmic adaptor subunit [Polaromonas sp.]
MAKKAVYVVVALAGIAAASGAAWWYQKPKAADAATGPASAAAPAPAVGGSGPAGGRPPTVEAARVEVARLTDDSQAVGSLRSRRGVVLRPEVSGRITQLNFTDGQRVRKGQVLVQFDDQLPRAQVQQSMAELSIAQANQKRNQELVAQNFVSQRSLDESSANLQVAQAKLALARATASRLKIVAPFDGIAGIRLVNVGDYLKDGADIVNVEDIEAIFVDFRLPERLQGKVKRGQQALLDIDALPGRKYTAVIQAIDPLIDANGRSVGVRACVDNRQLQLRPGMFARVNTVFSVRENARVIPEEAIVPQGSRQFVIKLVEGTNDLGPTTQRVEVKVGLRSPGKVEILEGLSPGDRVVTTGQQRVQRDGTIVKVVEVAANNAPARPAGAASAAASSAAASSPAPVAPPVSVASGAASPAIGAPVAASVSPVLTGPNPCGPSVAQATPSAQPTRSPAAPAARTPA